MGAVPAWSLPLSGADQALVTQGCNYRGITVRETAGAVAVVRLFDHASGATGTLLETVALAAGGSFSARDDSGIRAGNGIYVDVTGAIEGAVRIA